MRYASKTPARLVLLISACITVLVLSGCSGDDAFESNDYFMDYLTTVPLGKQIESTSGRASGWTSKAVLQGGVEARVNSRHQDAIDQAEEVLEAGDAQLASELLDEAVTGRPGDHALRGKRANVAIQLRDPETAQEHWKQQDVIGESVGWTGKDWYWEEMLAETDAAINEAVAISAPGPNGGGDLVAATYRRRAEVLEGAAFHAASQGNDELVQEYERRVDEALDVAEIWESF
jgi:hypothetical protein